MTDPAKSLKPSLLGCAARVPEAILTHHNRESVAGRLHVENRRVAGVRDEALRNQRGEIDDLLASLRRCCAKRRARKCADRP